ncbi:FAD-binding domain-containing protein [Rickenella mellea]|uniref:FAD-binding domain-containing protein n=1 Tax=Rickenella mellea TaxID=50990 RepID=A0A4Y7Q9J1_9AGAM|nr:FAD-binding domain-containing protein [Rickenella mellea]
MSSVPSAQPVQLSTIQRAHELLIESFPDLVSLPGSTQYSSDIAHWSKSCQDDAICSITPQTATDVANILSIIGRDDIRVPFAVKGGGHSYNSGHSSTKGIQVSMSKFNSLTHDPVANTVTIGAGLRWDEVYKLLEPLGIMVVGGRVPGVGIAGLSLGGGFTWKTDQFGLTVDTIVAHDIVLPSGEFVHVTEETHPDLFFALKGGFNNFGIVTAFTYEVHPQTQVYGGSIIFGQDVVDEFIRAFSDFDLNNKDPKAQLIVTFAYVAGQFAITTYLFYDGPTPPPGVFDKLLSINAYQKDLKTRSFSEFLTAAFRNGDPGIGPFRTANNSIPIVKYTVPILKEMVNQVLTLGASLTEKLSGSVVIVTCSAEPYIAPFAHSKGGAYPHPPTRQVTPASPWIGVQVSNDPSQQTIINNAIKQMSHAVQAKAVEEGQSRWDDLLYPNYASADTPLESMYGENLPRLHEIAKKVDPRSVMRLAGGFKFGQ